MYRQVKLSCPSPIYDRAKHVISVDASIENASKEPLRGRIKVVVVSLNSRLGRIAVANSDDLANHEGAVWDFTEQIENGALAAGAQSRFKRLEFRLAERPDVDRFLRRLMVSVEAKVFVSPSSNGTRLR